MHASLLTRQVGNTAVSAIGLGTAYYGVTEPDEERFKLLNAAYEEGCTFWDTADVCGNSEEFIGKWYAFLYLSIALLAKIKSRFRHTGKRDEIFLATKFGPMDFSTTSVDPEHNVKFAFEKSIKRLGVETIDLYYLHSTDDDVSIEVDLCRTIRG